MELKQPVKLQAKKGIALLMTLSIMALLTISLMKTFESRSVEVAHLENNLDRFQAMTLARSLFRAFLITIKTKGIKPVIYGITQLPPIPIPIGKGFFSNLSLKVMDTRFLLNQSRRWENDPTREIIFANIYGHIKREQNKNNYEDASVFEIYPLIGGIVDWTDQNNDLNIEFGGKEDYSFDEIPFYNKNSDFDYLSEVKLVNGFAELKINEHSLYKYFRIFGKTEKIDLNLASKQEIIDFLGNYKDIADYTHVYSFREEIAQTAKRGYDNTPESKYITSLKLRNNLWEKEMEGLGIDLNQKEKTLFTEKAEFFEINFLVTKGRVKIPVQSKIKIQYFKDLNIKSITILTFKLG